MPYDAAARERFARTEKLLGARGMERVARSRVMLFGLGGVGSYAAEALARMGVGDITIVDADTVMPSNINRQLPALISTIGRSKAAVVKERMADINPLSRVTAIESFYTPRLPVAIPDDTDVVLDAIDTVSAKLHIAQQCARLDVPLISCMGMGNRLDPTLIRIGDIFDTEGCPLCRVMRRELRRLGISALRCVYSLERPVCAARADDPGVESSGPAAPGSIAFVPSVAGLYMAYEAMRVMTGHEA